MTKTIKSAISLILSVVMLSVAVPVSSSVAATTDTLSYVVTQVNGHDVTDNTAIFAGDSVEVELQLDNHDTVQAVQTGLQFDKSLVSILSYEFSSAWADAGYAALVDNGESYDVYAVSTGLAPVEKIGEYDGDNLVRPSTKAVLTILFSVESTAFASDIVISAPSDSASYVTVANVTEPVVTNSCTFTVSADKAELLSTIATAKTKDVTAYTVASRTAFTSAIASAQAVYDNATATQEEVTKAIQGIKSAEAGLVELASAADKEALLSEIRAAQNECDKNPQDYYTVESLAAFSAEIARLQAIYDDADAEKSVVVAATADPAKAVELLKVKTFTVQFLDDNGTVIKTQIVEYGKDASQPDVAPTKDADSSYTYAFTGWDTVFTNVKSNLVIKPLFTSSPINYTVAFVDYDGTVLKSPTDYNYGDTVVVPADPTRPADNTYTYSFTGWSPEVSTVTGSVTYKAQYSKTYIDYTITFVSEGETYETKTYHYGDTVVLPEVDPTKAETNECTYTFSGWGEVASTVTGNATYTASFTTSYKQFTVTFVDEDGETVISTAKYYYGEEVQIPADPTKPSDSSNTYVFAGWDKEVTTAVADATYTATYVSTNKQFTITFVSEGEVVDSQTYTFGQTIVPPTDPTKTEDETYTYTFAGWGLTEGATVAGNATYTATFTPVYKEFTVKFLDEDGSELSSVTYHYGDVVSVPTNPTKAADNTYTYTFAGWDKSISVVKGDATYKATFASNYIDYIVTFLNEGEVFKIQKYHYGDTLVVPTQVPTKAEDATYYYTFTGWEGLIAGSTVTESTSYSASYSSALVAADYTEVDSVISQANAVLNDGTVYTSVSVARLNGAVSAVDRTKRYDEQSQVDAMAQAITVAINSMVTTTEYDKINATCLAVNSNAYTPASYSKFASAMNAAKKYINANYNTEDATQLDVDEAVAALSAAYALLEANFQQIDGAVAQGEVISGSTSFVISANENLDNTTLEANDGGANIAYLKYLDKQGNEVSADTTVLGTGFTVQLVYNGVVTESHVIVIYGDINGDGQVTMSDVMLAKAMEKSTAGFTASQIAAAKCGGDSVNVAAVIAAASRV